MSPLQTGRLPDEVLDAAFAESTAPLTDDQARVEASRCLFCFGRTGHQLQYSLLGYCRGRLGARRCLGQPLDLNARRCTPHSLQVNCPPCSFNLALGVRQSIPKRS